jgi:hypothetical protein
MFRFTIRDMLWLTVVVGLSLGWYLDYQRLTNQPKLYQDDEILARNRDYFNDSIDAGMGRDVVPDGTAMPLSQVFKTLGVDPKRLTNCEYRQYNRGISLSWQLSPSYYLVCSTGEGADDTLAFDDPNRMIYGAQIQRREEQEPSIPAQPVNEKEEALPVMPRDT